MTYRQAIAKALATSKERGAPCYVLPRPGINEWQTSNVEPRAGRYTLKATPNSKLWNSDGLAVSLPE